MTDEALSLICAAASDTGVKKVNALCTIFGVNNKRIKFRFYEICATRSENCSKSEIPFQEIDNALSKEQLRQCFGVGLDNTNSNMGNRYLINKDFYQFMVIVEPYYNLKICNIQNVM